MAPVDDNKSLSRAEKAQQTRRRMLASARELFVSEGYSRTTMIQIADRADVAVQTLYYTFQTKGKLLIEVVEDVAAGGDGPVVPVPQRPWFREMMSATSQQRILALMVEHGSAIYERVAHLWPVVTEAMSDADVADYWARMNAGRRNAQRHEAARIAEVGSLKPGLSVDQAGDLLALLAGHAPYQSLVEDAGWSMVGYKSWLFTTLLQQLLGDDAVDPAAVEDTSFSELGRNE